MKRSFIIICSFVMAALLFSGCAMTTVDGMYQIPKRSDNYNSLQSAIDQAMSGMVYCAPLAGENRQTVHVADLDGDGIDEYLLFAKCNQEKPLRILVFQKIDNVYVNIDVVECNGSGFDQVEYVDMDGGGVEVIIGCQLNNQVIRSATVYSFSQNDLIPMITVNYTKFLTVDLDADNLAELFLLRPGQTETDNGLAELYRLRDGKIESYGTAPMSQPSAHLKRVILGKLDGGKAAVYVASMAGEASLITDVYTLIENKIINVSLSHEFGTSIQTMRNFYVYADDIDSDGVVELPSLIPMQYPHVYADHDAHRIVRWYAITAKGEAVDKLYTYHNFADGWYLQLFNHLAPRTVAMGIGNVVEFYLWDSNYENCEKIMTLYTFSGEDREERGLSENRFILQKTDTLVYAARLEDAAKEYDITQENVVYSFRLIQQDWKTGET